MQAAEEPPFSLRDGIVPDPVAERIAQATVDLSQRDGLKAVTAEMVLAAAAVSRADFEARFEGVADVANWVWAQMHRIFVGGVTASFDAVEGPWREGIRAAAYTAADIVGAYPRAVRFVAGEVFVSGGDLAQAYIEETMIAMTKLVDGARQDLPDPEAVSPTVAQLVVGELFAQLIELTQRDDDSLADPAAIVPQLLAITVRPYFGAEAAAEELTTPRPA